MSKPLPFLRVTGDITTAGGEGMSLVRGVQVQLKAIALSIKPGGQVGAIDIGGRVRTSGDNVVSVEISRDLGTLTVAGGISATGSGSDGVHIAGQRPDLTGITITAANGTKIVRTHG